MKIATSTNVASQIVRYMLKDPPDDLEAYDSQGRAIARNVRHEIFCVEEPSPVLFRNDYAFCLDDNQSSRDSSTDNLRGGVHKFILHINVTCVEVMDLIKILL